MRDSPRPNFLIVGAAKAGTSSLWDWLSRHPEVFMPENKEPGFFTHGYGLTDFDEYLRLFEAGRHKPWRGEATAAYLAAPESPQWIHDTLGRIKIIIILRNPIQRAYSLYCWMLMEGYEPIESFEAALAQEDARRASERFRHECPQYFADYFYFHTGLYHQQVKRYLDIFGPEAVHVCLFDDLVSHPADLHAKIGAFLGLSNPGGLVTTAKNVSVIPKSIGWQYRLRAFQRWWQRRLGRGSLPITFFADLMMKANVAAGAKTPMPVSARQKLNSLYQDDVARLSALIGRDLSHWVKS